MKGYGDVSAESAKKVADLAFGTVRLGQTTLPELSAGMQGVIGVASAGGVKMEEFFAVMATGTGVLGGAGEVSNKLNSFLTQLQKPGADLAAVMERLGYASGTAWVESRGLAGVMADVKQASDDSGISLAKLLRRTEATQLVTALAGDSAITYAEKLGELQTATGELDTAVKAQREGVGALGFAFNQIKQSGTVLAQVLGDGLGAVLTVTLVPAVKLAVKFVGSLREWFDKLKASGAETDNAFGRLSASFRSYGIMVKEYFELLKPALMLLWETVKEVFQKIGDIVENFMDTIGIFIDVFSGVTITVIRLLRGDWAGAWEAMRTMMQDVWLKVQGIVLNSVESILRTLEKLLGGIPGVGNLLAGWREGLKERMEALASEQATEELRIASEGSAAVKEVVVTTYEQIRTSVVRHDGASADRYRRNMGANGNGCGCAFERNGNEA